MNYKLSVVMPNYNKEAWIADSIESVIRQSYKNWELVIVDDASTDNSMRIIKHYYNKHKNIRWFGNVENEGIAYTRNAGTLGADGDIIVVQDSDDFMYQDRLKYINKYFNKGDCDLFYSDYIHGSHMLKPMREEKFAGEDPYDLLYPKQRIGHLTLAYWKWVWEKHKYDSKRTYNDDYPFLIDCYNDPEIKFKHCPKPLTIMRLLGEGVSITKLNTINKEVKELAKTIKKRDE